MEKKNDVRIGEVSEEDVLNESGGGNKWMTAKWIFYFWWIEKCKH